MIRKIFSCSAGHAYQNDKQSNLPPTPPGSKAILGQRTASGGWVCGSPWIWPSPSSLLTSLVHCMYNCITALLFLYPQLWHTCVSILTNGFVAKIYNSELLIHNVWRVKGLGVIHCIPGIIDFPWVYLKRPWGRKYTVSYKIFKKYRNKGLWRENGLREEIKIMLFNIKTLKRCSCRTEMYMRSNKTLNSSNRKLISDAWGKLEFCYQHREEKVKRKMILSWLYLKVLT